ncbi:MAG TPA: hypothetical protein VF982_10450 [Anaerolineales bacterium]
MPNHPEPNWQPISQLPLLASMVDGVLANSEEQHETFSHVRAKPHVLDDEIVHRAINLYQAQLDDLWFYEEQFARWLKAPLTDGQREEAGPSGRDWPVNCPAFGNCRKRF